MSALFFLANYNIDKMQFLFNEKSNFCFYPYFHVGFTPVRMLRAVEVVLCVFAAFAAVSTD